MTDKYRHRHQTLSQTITSLRRNLALFADLRYGRREPCRAPGSRKQHQRRAD